MVERIINTTRHSETGQVPAHLVFGNIGIDLDRYILTAPSTDVQDSVDPSTYGAQLISQQQTLIELAETHQEDQIRQRAGKRQAEPTTVFEVGSYILCQHPNGRTSKLDPKHTGPFEVVQQHTRLCTLSSHNHITYADEVPRVLSRMCVTETTIHIPKPYTSSLAVSTTAMWVM